MRVRFEPVGAEIDCAPEETILEAAFRHGLNLAHGCREGQCSACKCFLLAGDVELKQHSSFALSDSEATNGYALMCRALPSTDLVVELLHHDGEALALEHPPRDGQATVTSLEQLTPEVTRLVLDAPGLQFTPGQYLDLHVAGAKRSFSMANLPGEPIELLIRRYPGGRLSGMLGSEITAGTPLTYTGPYGSLRLHESAGPILMVASGTGLAPILSLLRELAVRRDTRPIRLIVAAREPFCEEEIAAAGERLEGFASTHESGRNVPEQVQRLLTPTTDVYMCGAPKLLDAVRAVVPDVCRVFEDRFTVSADAPRQRRASVYDEVTLDTQPSVHRHLSRGWLVSFNDGRGTWEERSTALRCRDWFAFRDPGELWERQFFLDASAAERGLEQTTATAIGAGLLEDIDPRWAELLRTQLQVAAFVEHGLWFATATIGRDCLSDTVAHCVCLEAAMKQRSAQAIVLEAMDLEPFLGPIPIDAARAAFLSEPEWQPARRYLERLAATPDWGEVIVAANLVFDPLVGTLLRREVGIRAAGACGDPLTPALARAAEREWQWMRAWTVALGRLLMDDPEHGAGNRNTIVGWVRAWMPAALAALDALAPLARQVPAGLDPGRSRERVLACAAGVLLDAGLGDLADELGPVAVERGASRRPVPGARRSRRAEVANPQSPPPDSGSRDQDYVGIVIARSTEGDAVARLLTERDEVEVIEQPAFWEARARGRLTIRYDELSRWLGYEIDAYGVQRELSTHYGRMVAGDEALMLFADPTEALAHLLA